MQTRLLQKIFQWCKIKGETLPNNTEFTGFISLESQTFFSALCVKYPPPSPPRSYIEDTLVPGKRKSL